MPCTYSTLYKLAGVLVVSTFELACRASTSRLAPGGSDTVVNATPVGTKPWASSRAMPNESAPCTTAIDGSVDEKLYPVTLCAKPTLTCFTNAASANTYTLKSEAAASPESATTAGPCPLL